MVMIRCGLRLLELARAIHMKHVLMCPSQKLSKSPTLFAGIFQNRSVWMFQDKSVCRFQTRFAQTSLYKSAKVCQDSGSHLDGVAVGNGPVVIDARKNEKSVQF